MTIDPRLQTLLNDLGLHMRLDGLRLDDDGYCALRFDNEFTINFQYGDDHQQLLMYADLGIPARGEKLYSTLLQANLFWRLTMGATLSLSGDEPVHVIIALQQPWQSQTVTELAAVLEQFVNTVEDWAEAVRGDAKVTDEDNLTISPLDNNAFIRV